MSRATLPRQFDESWSSERLLGSLQPWLPEITPGPIEATDPPHFADLARQTLNFPLHAWQEEILCPLIERLAYERGLRVAFHAPPQYGKSVLLSQRAPAWLLGVDPLHRVGLAAYNETHATGFGAVVRDLMLTPEYLAAFPDPRCRVRSDAAAGKFFTQGRQALNDAQPSFLALGLLSGFVGKSVDTLIIDDPYKSVEDARSEAINEKVWRFWKDTASVRIGAAANVVVMFHRYHEDDLAGRLLAEGGWEYIRLPALADANEDGSDPTGREVGELLSPMRSREWVEAQQEGNPLTFLGQFQGRPTAPQGQFFQRGWFEIVGAVPVGAAYVRYWDKAGAKPGKGDWTVGVLLAKAPDGRFYVMDVQRGQWPADERNATIKQTAELDKRLYGRVRTYIEQPPGLGKESTDAVVLLLSGYPVEADPVSKEKIERAEPVQGQARAGNVKIVKGAWDIPAFLNELAAFPNGKHDDQVDALSGAFNKSAQAQSPGRFRSF
jgi:predicted phage terminase large subunit-like protein